MKLFAERRVSFPDPEDAIDGVLAVDDNVSVDRLLEAYSFGIFPWPVEGYPTLWFSPEERGVLDFADLHVSRSLRKFMRHAPFTYTFDRCFARVVDLCAEVPRRDESGTWITPRLRRAYVDFFEAGYAHSLEVWKNGELVGGLYGTYVGGVFGGESMFHLVDNASKAAVLKLTEFLRAHGLSWMDTQMVTPVLEAFGGQYIPRSAFLRRLERARSESQRLTFTF